MLNTVIIVEEFVENDALAGTIDGANDTFSTSFNYEPGTIRLYLNGLRQSVGLSNDYNTTLPNFIVMNNPPLPGDILIADYQRK